MDDQLVNLDSAPISFLLKSKGNHTEVPFLSQTWPNCKLPLPTALAKISTRYYCGRARLLNTTIVSMTIEVTEQETSETSGYKTNLPHDAHNIELKMVVIDLVIK